MNGNKINNIKGMNVANNKKNVYINQSSQVSSYHHRRLKKRRKKKRKRMQMQNLAPSTQTSTNRTRVHNKKKKKKKRQWMWGLEKHACIDVLPVGDDIHLRRTVDETRDPKDSNRVGWGKGTMRRII